MWFKRLLYQLLPWLSALVVGWLASWTVAWWLAPRPVFEVTAGKGGLVSFSSQHLSVLERKNASEVKHLQSYRLTDGHPINTLDFRRCIDKKHPAYGTAIPVPQEYVLDRFYREKTNEMIYMLLDPQNGEAFRMSEQVESEWHPELDSIDWNSNQPTRTYVRNRALPLQVMMELGMNGISASPGSMLLSQAGCSLPDISLHIVRVLSIPNNTLITSFLLEAAYSRTSLTVSPSGRYVSCIGNEYHARFLKQQMKPGPLLWDSLEARWREVDPAASNTMSGKPHCFLNEEIYITPVYMDAKKTTNGGFQLINARTGRVLDRLPQRWMSDQPHNVLSAGRQLWYLAEVEDQNQKRLWELRYSPDGETVKILGTSEYQNLFDGLTAGLQSVSTPMPPWKLWLYEYMGKHPSLEFLRPWLQSATTYVFDWTTGQNIAMWSGYHYWQRSHDGQYLYVVHGERDSIRYGTFIHGGLAQVYRMPLTLYSPWWHRSAWIVVSLLILVWFARQRRSVKLKVTV